MLGRCVVVKAAVQSFHPRRHATTPSLTATTYEDGKRHVVISKRWKDISRKVVPG